MADPLSLKPKRRTRQSVRSLQILAVLIAMGVALTVWNGYSTGRDAAIATGRAGLGQERFFVDSADRPDIENFFLKLTPRQRVSMAAAIGRYSDPGLAKLLGRLLNSLDQEARTALTDSMTRLAAKQPAAVAVELKDLGSFQLLGAFTALRSIGAAALPVVAQRLSDKDSLSNAVRFLVESGPSAIPFLHSALDAQDKDERIAAADGLSKLRASEAVPKLTDLYRTAYGDEREAYLAALGGIGDVRSEPLLSRSLTDLTLPASLRSVAAIGLGRVATPSAVATLWQRFHDPDDRISSTVLQGLRLAGDVSLRSPDALHDQLIAVAAGIRTPSADAIIGSAIADKPRRSEAALAATGRPSLVATLQRQLMLAHPGSDGEFIDAAIGSLLSTTQGRKIAESWISNPALSGFVRRRLSLTAASDGKGS